MFIEKLLPSAAFDFGQDLMKSVELKKFHRGDVVYAQGDRPKGLYFLKKGLIGLVLLGEDSGKEHLVRFFKEGDVFGHRSLFADESYHASATAIRDIEVEFLPKDSVIEFFDQNPIAYKEIVSKLAKELRKSEVDRVMILEKQVLERVSNALIYLKELHPTHSWTRQEIANFCGSTTSTVIKALAVLEEKNIIQQSKRDIEIINKEELYKLNVSFMS